MKFYRFIADIQLFGNFFMRKVLNTAHYKNFSGIRGEKRSVSICGRPEKE